MKKIITALASLLACTAAAHARPVPAPPVVTLAPPPSSPWTYAATSDDGEDRWYYSRDSIRRDAEGFARVAARNDEASGTSTVLALQFDCRKARVRSLAEIYYEGGVRTGQADAPSTWRWVEEGSISRAIGELACR